jgi:hypothetical protein
MPEISMTFSSDDSSGDLRAAVSSLVIAGWTGRDPAAMEAHIEELEKLGVKRPTSTPVFYRGAVSLLTQSPDIEVVGEHSSGEAEPVIFSLPDGLWLGVGSDHTDRQVETVGITISKQMCAKPVSRILWRFSKVSARWDELLIRCYATKSGKRRLYQEGALAKMRHPDDLTARYLGAGATLPVGTAMFCGTLAVHVEIEGADLFQIELEDPVAKRKITHQYTTLNLPVAG